MAQKETYVLKISCFLRMYVLLHFNPEIENLSIKSLYKMSDTTVPKDFLKLTCLT